MDPEIMDRGHPDLIDARLHIKRWLNSFIGASRDELLTHFDGEALIETEWEDDGVGGVRLSYDHHDYELDFYLDTEGFVVMAFYSTGSSM